MNIRGGHQIDLHVEEPVDHSGELTAGGQAQGLQGVVAHAPDEAHSNDPLHSIFRIGENLLCIHKVAEAGSFGHIFAGKLGITVEHGDHFLPGDVLQRPEGLVSVALHNAFRGGPGYGIFVVRSGSNVGEALGGGDLGSAGHAV